MENTAQAGYMAATEIAEGGAYAWRLPPDPRCASIGRSLVHGTLTALRLPGELVDAAVLSVSELATNALNHGLRAGPYDPVVPPELWIWRRTTPAPQLVVAVFDTCRTAWPDATPGDLLAENGKGLGIVGVVSGAWGAHLSRSRFHAVPGGGPASGKVVWSAFTLTGPWPGMRRIATPSAAAQGLAAALSARGIENVAHRHEVRVSLVSVPLSKNGGLNVWVRPGGFTFTDLRGARVHRPVADLHDVAEHLVRRIEESDVG
ncbi:hypothetical protein GCM10023196_024510 [Actinoallomurus vinaceus]|uniref:Histidine kinase/HSP90-like ATPase domain-containing protein n=1 Tax=Actinoallomurus vinaceus TaxID=1080074 RepID=A0ABP8U5R2_9ACTN